MPKKRPPRRAKPRRKKQPNTASSLALLPDRAEKVPADPGQPAWAPSQAEAAAVPEAVRQPLRDLILPIYERSVLQATDPLEQSVNATLTHLLWLEVLEQFNLKQQYTNIELQLNFDAPRHEEIDHLLRVLEAKVRVGHLLVRLRELRDRDSARHALPAAPVLEAIAHDGGPKTEMPAEDLGPG